MTATLKPSQPPIAPLADDALRIGTHTLASRLIVGTGKYSSYALMGESLALSGASCVTVAVRRERLVNAQGGKHSRSHRSAALHPAPQHGRLFQC